jgi:hypothetical protein
VADTPRPSSRVPAALRAQLVLVEASKGLSAQARRAEGAPLLRGSAARPASRLRAAYAWTGPLLTALLAFEPLDLSPCSPWVLRPSIGTPVWTIWCSYHRADVVSAIPPAGGLHSNGHALGPADERVPLPIARQYDDLAMLSCTADHRTQPLESVGVGVSQRIVDEQHTASVTQHCRAGEPAKHRELLTGTDGQLLHLEPLTSRLPPRDGKALVEFDIEVGSVEGAAVGHDLRTEGCCVRDRTRRSLQPCDLPQLLPLIVLPVLLRGCAGGPGGHTVATIRLHLSSFDHLGSCG